MTAESNGAKPSGVGMLNFRQKESHKYATKLTAVHPNLVVALLRNTLPRVRPGNEALHHLNSCNRETIFNNAINPYHTMHPTPESRIL